MRFVIRLYLMVNLFKRPNVLLLRAQLYLALSVYFKLDELLCCRTGSDNERATPEESKGEGVIDGAV